MTDPKRGTDKTKGWVTSLDSENNHPDWEHTLDYDYVPKGTKRTIDGDHIYPSNQSTAHL